MACSCNKQRLVKPTETCIFCAHKHIVTAKELFLSGSVSMAIGQLNCASKHYNSNFPEMRDRTDDLILKLYDKSSDSSGIFSSLAYDAWQMVLENQTGNKVYPEFSRKIQKPATADLKMAHLAVSTARALYDLELGYRSVNKSEAMGELILAAWHLQKDHIGLAWKCKHLWGRIEKLQDCSVLLENLENELWDLLF